MWRGGDQGLAEEYDYVMHGKVGRRTVVVAARLESDGFSRDPCQIYKFDDSARGADQT
jgi:hypothetical protein